MASEGLVHRLPFADTFLDELARVGDVRRVPVRHPRILCLRDAMAIRRWFGRAAAARGSRARTRDAAQERFEPSQGGRQCGDSSAIAVARSTHKAQ